MLKNGQDMPKYTTQLDTEKKKQYDSNKKLILFSFHYKKTSLDDNVVFATFLDCQSSTESCLSLRIQLRLGISVLFK